MNHIIARENGCVASAISVMRGFLGYRTCWPRGVPIPSEKYGMSSEKLAVYSQKFFPKHKVVVWGDGDKRYPLLPDGRWIYAFMYYSKDAAMGHMVVGQPFICWKHMKIAAVIGVRI